VATVLTILVLPAGYALFFGREPKARQDENQPANQGELFDDHRDLPMAAE
jgi:multidrug efflux pump